MESGLNKENKSIEQSSDELMQCVRHEIEDILHSFFSHLSIEVAYEARNEATKFVYFTLKKKYLNHRGFDEIKKQMARTIGYDYLVRKYLQNPD